MKNFRKVESWLYRGGQPDPEGLRFLRELHVKTIVSLRWRPDVIEEERLQVAAFGFDYVSIPLTYWTYPSARSVDQFLCVLDDHARRPIYVHCLHGSDRTGLFIAIFRMARQGWSPELAYREMKACGFHFIPVYHFKWALFYYAMQLRGRGSHGHHQ